MDEVNKTETSAHVHCTPKAVETHTHMHCNQLVSLKDALIKVLVQYKVPLKDVRHQLDSLAEQITSHSDGYLYHPEWSCGTRKQGLFERIYGVPPFSPCTFDAAGMTVLDSEGKIVPHKKLVIGHLGNQELTLDVLDRTDQ
ncbi:hypothetical protein [Acidaminococcus timonensis]|uniref:hypothetical protein n=1 Tax=Acidaminococcus timonensis TaxID=1871002 RepID=UPI00307909B2